MVESHLLRLRETLIRVGSVWEGIVMSCAEQSSSRELTLTGKL
jgi:hypothetical protein